MRLTLRTLLAHLDNALSPAEAQEIAQKLQTSPIAVKLADRIGELLRSGDCCPAPTLDPNVIAGYLDNTLDPDLIMAVETACLESPSLIEETAACHQLLFRGTFAQPALSAAGREGLYALTPGTTRRDAVPAATASAEEASLDVPRWYYRLFGEEFGPVPIDLLIQVLASGQLKPTDEIRADPSPKLVSVREFLASPAPADKTSSAPAPATPATPPAVEVPVIADVWFCQSKNVGPGPYTFEELLFHARQGLLDPGDQVRFGSQGAWRRAGSIGRLMAELPFEQKPAAAHKPSASAPSQAPQVNEHKQNAMSAAAVPAGTPAMQASAMAQADEWYVLLGNQTWGPMKLAELLDLFRAGRLQPTDGIRRGAASNWMYAGMLPMLLASGQDFPSPATAMPAARS